MSRLLPCLRRLLCVTLLAAVPGCGVDSPASTGGPSAPPNIVIVFADDMGWGDLAVQGAQGISTPHLDRMADEGTRFTSFYVSQPVCSASRAALLTGCYSNRIGIHGALGPGDTHGLADAETTLAEVCRAAGYATAIFGKWHLGHHPQFLPTRHGFDSYYGIPYSNDMGRGHATNPEGWGDLPTIEGEQTVGLNTDQRRFTSDFTDRAVAFIEDSVAAGRPFFVYLAHPMPHVPLAVAESSRGRSERGLYGDVMEELDDSLGRVLDTLQRAGVDDSTLVLFTSDNGPWLSYGDHAGSTGGYREGKATTFEGGVRVPCLVRWPGVVPAGRVCDEPAMTIDVLPTVAGLLAVPLPALPIDGKDIWPLIAGVQGARSPQEAYYFWYAHGELQALRSGRWKLHLPHDYVTMEGQRPGHDGKPGRYAGASTPLALYDLLDDPNERTNLVSEQPDVVARLTELADDARLRLGDKLTDAPGTERRKPGRLR